MRQQVLQPSGVIWKCLSDFYRLFIKKISGLIRIDKQPVEDIQKY